MKCNGCNKDYGRIMITLNDAAGSKSYCPNCLAVMVCNDELSFVNNPNLIDDVTGKPGAVEFVAYNERYVLESKRMLRLISHSLRRREALKLIEKYGDDKYMLHDDFYDENGVAIQPMN